MNIFRYCQLSFCVIVAITQNTCLCFTRGFPKCESSRDCIEEEYNKVLLSCCNGLCKECCTNSDCHAERPFCDSLNHCVACLDNKDCNRQNPFCSAGQCRECLDSHDCQKDKPICRGGGEGGGGFCSNRCHYFSDCHDRRDPGRVCKEGKCTDCEKDSDCPPSLKCTAGRCLQR